MWGALCNRARDFQNTNDCSLRWPDPCTDTRHCMRAEVIVIKWLTDEIHENQIRRIEGGEIDQISDFWCGIWDLDSRFNFRFLESETKKTKKFLIIENFTAEFCYTLQVRSSLLSLSLCALCALLCAPSDLSCFTASFILSSVNCIQVIIGLQAIHSNV